MATNAQVDGEACCAQRATIVPAVALCVDIGLPLTLLLVAYIYLRRKGSPGACISPQTTLPLIQVHEQENVSVLDLSATLPVPAERGRSRLPSIMLSVMSSVSLKLFETAAEQPATVRDRAHEIETRLVDLAVEQEELVMQELCTDRRGLTASEAASRLLRNGPAFYKQTNGPSLLQMIWNAVMQPFNGLMAAVAVLTICPPTNDTRTFTLIMILLIGAILLRFREEVKSTRTARSLLADFSAQTTVLRDGRGVKVDSNETVVGDIVKLSGNDIVPADLRILNSHDLLIGMASLTGEATPVQKSATCPNRSINILDAANVAFQGTNVISGTATGVVLATGKDTYAGHIATSMSCSRQLNAFDFAVRRVVYLFIWFLVFMVPVVIVLSGISTGSWSGAVALGLSVAVGLSPQMMPMIITANLSRGAEQMRRHDAIVKRLDAVQNMGSMSVLCTDKTGTLTQEKLLLTQHLNADGEMSEEVLHLAFLNSVMQEASENPVDQAISTFGTDLGLVCGSKTFKVREIPFDFQRRMSSVIYSEQEDLRLVCKGAVEDVMPRCDRILTQNLTVRLDEAWIDTLTERCALLNGQGLKVLAVAQKTLKGVTTDSSRLDETGLVFCGYIVFLDPPKASVEPTVKTLKGLGVTIKVLTGDSLLVAKRLCEDVGIAVHSQITGSQLANMSASEVEDAVLRTTIFARVTPRQKLMIIATLQKQEHICGYLGDGTNDTLALQKADVGICVHSGTDAAKNAADLILLGEDLASISEGVRLGRVTYGNTIKYIKFAASSSFGNTFSILAGAAWLPFNPLLPIQVLALNLLYNISQLAIPWDSMDEEFLKKPRRWSAKFLGLYMLIIGPTSSIFDMITFLISWYVFKANNSSTTAAGTFTSIWFLESLMTQTFIVHLLRTERLPFIQSRASWPLMVSSFGTMAVGAVLCFIPQVNQTLQLRKPPNLYYAYLIGTVAVYSVTVQCFKAIYISVFHHWL